MTATALRRATTTAVVVTYLQLVFGGIVRVTGSGMGCGDHWPRCNGSWIPPFTDPTVMIEWTHRLLALLVVLSAAAAVWAANRAVRREVPGADAVSRSSTAGLILVISVALLGMVTVKLGNTAFATVGHWTLAMALLAVLIAGAVRSGALGGEGARAEGGTSRAARSLGAGAALAFLVVVMGGLTAKFPGAAAACPSFPTCGDTPAGIAAGAAHIQVTHRFAAILLLLHMVAVATAISRRAGESAVVRRAARLPAFLLIVQVGLGIIVAVTAAPGAGVRIAHQATGVAIWMLLFAAAYLASHAARGTRSAGLPA